MGLVTSGRIKSSIVIVWCGLNATGLLADGSLFDPSTSQWTVLNSANPPSARYAATAVWTGTRFLVWGGQGLSPPLNSGAQLLFSSATPLAAWQAIATSGAPSARSGHTAVWTGQKMIVWGGGTALHSPAMARPIPAPA